MTGFDSSSRDGPIGPRGAGRPSSGKSRAFSGSACPARLAASFRSQPAQKAPPAPQNTATAASGSRSKARKGLDQRLRTLDIHGVARLGARMDDGCDGAVPFDGDAHGSSHLSLPERPSPLVMISHQPVEQAHAPARTPALVGL